jgi:hypothetical protein
MRPRQPASSFERALFGPLRTLNIRASMLSGDDSAARVESWLRSKQVELSGDVLVITGRGAGSPSGISVVKEATRRVLNRLKRAGVIQSFGEDTPGSFIVRLAPLRSLLEAPARRKPSARTSARLRTTIHGLRPKTRDRLRYLACRAIDSLGVRNPSDSQVEQEMERQFSMIARSAPAGTDADRWMDSAITRVLREYEESER